MNFFVTLLSFIKMYIKRAVTYASMFQICMVGFLVLAKLKDYGLNIPMSYGWGVLYFFISFIAVVLIGYIDTKLGIFKEQNRIEYKEFPQIQEILKEVKASSERLEKIEKKLSEVK